jgi:hypothetical protein
MKHFLKTTIAAAAIAGAASFAAVPANAGVSFNLSIGLPIPGAVAIDYGSGGYCDDYGCPDMYWDMPVYYGPVYYGGRWFQGPIYYRDYGGTRWYWVRGGWRTDQWRGPRPAWWRGGYRVGPALGYAYYARNGFRHDRDRYWRGNEWRPGRDWDRDRWRNVDRANRVRIDEHHDVREMDRVRDRQEDRQHDRDNNHGGGMNGPGGGMNGPGNNGNGNGNGNGNKHKDHDNNPGN